MMTMMKIENVCFDVSCENQINYVGNITILWMMEYFDKHTNEGR